MNVKSVALVRTSCLVGFYCFFILSRAEREYTRHAAVLVVVVVVVLVVLVLVDRVPAVSCPMVVVTRPIVSVTKLAVYAVSRTVTSR